jgi:hypothetical protein
MRRTTKTIIRHSVSALALVCGGCLPASQSGQQSSAIYFYPDVQATMDVVGCSSGDCHGAGDTPMHVVPPAQGGDISANYQQVMPRTAGAAQSLFLTKPVAGAAIMHEGGKLIPMDGQTYRQWLAWIQAGAPLKAPSVMLPAPSAPAGGGGGGGGGGDMGGVMPMAACTPAQETTMSSHNKGQDCLSCHATGQNPLLRWTIAGTLWQDSFGTTPRAGATVTVVDARGLTLKLVSDVEGNFYTAQAVSFPLTVSASACPSNKAMMEKVPQGSCNVTACHDGGRPIAVP